MKTLNDIKTSRALSILAKDVALALMKFADTIEEIDKGTKPPKALIYTGEEALEIVQKIHLKTGKKIQEVIDELGTSSATVHHWRTNPKVRLRSSLQQKIFQMSQKYEIL